MPDTSTPNPSDDRPEDESTTPARPRLSLRRKDSAPPMRAGEDEGGRMKDEGAPHGGEQEAGGNRLEEEEHPHASSQIPQAPKPKLGLRLKKDEGGGMKDEGGVSESGVSEDGTSEGTPHGGEQGAESERQKEEEVPNASSLKPNTSEPPSFPSQPSSLNLQPSSPNPDLIDPPVSLEEAEKPREIGPTEKALRENPKKKPGLRLKKDEGERMKAEEPSSSNSHLPSTGEVTSANSGSSDEPLDLSALPFSLPDRIGDEPPPLPTFNSVVGTSGTPPRKVEKPKPSVSFDDLEPAHSDKAPPPIDAPVHQGKVRKRRSPIGKIMVFVIPLALLVLGGIYVFALLQQEPAPPVESTLPAVPPATNASVPSDAEEMGAGDLGEEGAVADAPIDPDPLIAVMVDELEVNLARRNATPQIVILNGVSFSPGDVVNPEAGLRFVGFHEDPSIRELVFEDSRGARYFRGY
jgi:hypothetical protein